MSGSRKYSFSKLITKQETFCYMRRVRKQETVSHYGFPSKSIPHLASDVVLDNTSFWRYGCQFRMIIIFYQAKWSKYPNHKSELVSHLNIDNSEKFDTQTWTPKQRYDQVPAGSKHHLPIKERIKLRMIKL